MPDLDAIYKLWASVFWLKAGAFAVFRCEAIIPHLFGFRKGFVEIFQLFHALTTFSTTSKFSHSPSNIRPHERGQLPIVVKSAHVDTPSSHSV